MPKRLEFTWRAKCHRELFGLAGDFKIHIWFDKEYKWTVEKEGVGQFADNSLYKTGSETLNSAKWRAIKAVTKYRKEQHHA